eukprot:scaffold5826_cov291-Prasinococcus_capsulatus_cf.AAC.3
MLAVMGERCMFARAHAPEMRQDGAAGDSGARGEGQKHERAHANGAHARHCIHLRRQVVREDDRGRALHGRQRQRLPRHKQRPRPVSAGVTC